MISTYSLVVFFPHQFYGTSNLKNYLVGSKDWFKDSISRWIAEACRQGCSKVSEGKLGTVLMVVAAPLVLLSIMHLFINRMAWKEEALRKQVS